MAHILIIEDQEPLGILYKSVLRKYNHETTFTTTGEAGIEAALRDKPDLVILDLLLPGIPGIEVARRLQESGILPGVPLIITIALDAQTIAESLNATAVLNKPFNIESILSTVNGALATASKE